MTVIFFSVLGRSVTFMRAMRFSMDAARFARCSVPCSCIGAGGRFEALFLGQLVLVVLELLLAAALALDRIIRVIAVIEITGAVVNFDHTVAALVDEPAVMGNDHHGAAVALQIFTQPVHRLHIQMVGRLVEQQDVGLLENDAGQIDARLFAAGQQRKLLCAHCRE